MDTFILGICAEDPEAVRVVVLALYKGSKLAFSNSRGTFVDVQFVFHMSSENNVNDNLFPLLYGWIERIDLSSPVQLIEETLLAPRFLSFVEVLGAGFQKSQIQDNSYGNNDEADFSTKKKGNNLESAGRVIGSLSFLLHVVSTPPQEHIHDPSLQDYMQTEEGSHRKDLFYASNTTFFRKVERFHSRLLFIPEWESLKNILKGDKNMLELHDDWDVLQNAVEAVLKYSQLLTEHPSFDRMVYVDNSTELEYITFKRKGK